ncbi:nucleoside triphosphate pyrophosphohydrolase [Sediminibacillus dalangtanensis]|uniref:Nucleoside triphosphate pyrophosphohydrolase n=1 Tax=Sediminibacillus dalangtanensis TaxID=2729421 RepID=A0ABX7VXI4_9BACI|nr:nucleoside triphosphate pyrophosphohydrolase [Sediminibacillus dalangtanensis]QTN01269.1 nucleoside triphosphate pyrophosphohydrolase [Sediminibacillus dalangtanensis]
MANNVEIIGLGAGDINQLPLGIYRKLIDHKEQIYVRTLDHPVIEHLKQEGVTFASFDEIYEKNQEFSSVYEEIAALLADAAVKHDVIYAVPGHPMLAEKTVQLLLENDKLHVSVTGGQSYLDALFTTLRIDPIDGFQFVDANSFKRNELEYRHHIVFCQVYDAFIASEVKLTLLEDLSPEHPVTIVEAAGSSQEKVVTIPLVELDQSARLSNLTSVYVAPVADTALNHHFFRLREVIAQLRGPNGCPWDKKQTHESLRQYLLEEAYEFIEAVNAKDDEAMIEEIGDVLLQVMLHSQIGEDEGFFTIDDVISTLTNKMIRRHPHVFGEAIADTAEEVVDNWQKIKAEEKQAAPSLLSGIPIELPQLTAAEELQKKAAKVGFDWGNAEPIWEKLHEELEEWREAIKEKKHEEIEKEFGDFLFAIVNLARYYKINPELSLNRTNTKFRDRFAYIEEQTALSGKNMGDMTLEELDHYWNEAKKME